jgi:methylmalonyl-CoA mutase cobalamin-binding domain/chain
MRRILMSQGAEVIHLGHNRSVDEIVTAALQEDAHGIAVSSYQGGHLEYFKYMIDLLRERGGANIKVFGGGGGVIVADEISELHDYGVTRIFSRESVYESLLTTSPACVSSIAVEAMGASLIASEEPLPVVTTLPYPANTTTHLPHEKENQKN